MEIKVIFKILVIFKLFIYFRDLKLNATHLQRLANLNTLCIRLNGLLELSMSAPFYFPIQQLCLTDVNIKLYDFGLLIRCVSQSLQHLCLERIKIVDSSESNDILVQLQRVRLLQSLRIDLGLSEVRILPILIISILIYT